MDASCSLATRDLEFLRGDKWTEMSVRQQQHCGKSGDERLPPNLSCQIARLWLIFSLIARLVQFILKCFLSDFCHNLRALLLNFVETRQFFNCWPCNFSQILAFSNCLRSNFPHYWHQGACSAGGINWQCLCSQTHSRNWFGCWVLQSWCRNIVSCCVTASL